MAADLNLTIYPEDKVETLPPPEMGLGSKITVTRATPVIINDASNAVTYRTWETTVKDLLSENSIVLGEKDVIQPEITSLITREMQIDITRVAETELKEEETIDYRTITKEDPNLEKGKTKIETPGKTGTKEKTYLVRRENGQEVSRTLLKEEVTQESQNKVVIVGTKVVVLGRGNATWYDLISGMTAAHNTLPKGTMVKVTAVNSGKSVVVKIIDRGIQSGAIIDLSADAFEKLAPLGAGIIPVVLTQE
ncbi:hypothetical protein A2V71_01675 [Candidatus Berkelbacteria bacterium RBG_13_40_8]|uniref:G5 domain-containing protein n=1 Tax=Candidatus Berkelbacteria bacterium RBG_13_40_8 TaxID=1797467 RepID=A0A1F5DPT4_9BACT|nr:MAG: hypothetical protein A2V71_01675 [Candidatus Berkelbacteria bacterium RBG_13_40_8]